MAEADGSSVNMNLKAENSYTVIGRSVYNNRDVVVLVAEGTARFNLDGMAFVSPMKGTVYVDIHTGLPLRMERTSGIQINGRTGNRSAKDIFEIVTIQD